MKNYDEVLKHITPQIKKADKLLRALEKRKFFNASGFTFTSLRVGAQSDPEVPGQDQFP